MDIKGTTTRIIVACSGNSPCTASIGNVCSAASSPLVGVLCNYPACPTIYQDDATQVEGTDGWNSWSASCAMGSWHRFTSGTVKIKKDPSMSGELVIDRGATSGDSRHFVVTGVTPGVTEGAALEMKDVTLTGGYTEGVRSLFFCVVVNCEYTFFDGAYLSV